MSSSLTVKNSEILLGAIGASVTDGKEDEETVACC